MVDINNSQDYDSDTEKALWTEEMQKAQALPIVPYGLGGIVPAGNSLLNSIVPPPTNPFLPSAPQATLGTYFNVKSKAKEEITDPLDFLRETYPGERVWRFILTHPDLDHMRGIKRLHDEIGFDNFWDTLHTKTVPNFRSDDDKEDWEFYRALRTGSHGLAPRNYTRGDSHFAYGQDELGRPGGDNMEILSPTPSLVHACNTAGKSNSLSIVLRVWHAGRAVLLPGDAEEDAWADMVRWYGSVLKSDFLKASHHGRDSGYHLDAVKLISPLITFVSVGRKPDTDASSKYRAQSARVASTRYHGNIELRIDDNGQHQWFVQRNAG